MNATEFRQIVKKIVAEEISSNPTFKAVLREEIRKQFPTLFAAVISETFANTKLKPPVADFDSPIEELQVPVKPPVQTAKKPVKYSNNPVLNRVLNETVGGVPSESTMNVGLSSPLGNSPSSMPPINEVAIQQQKTLGIYKDYRSLLKKVDQMKSGAKSFGGGSIGPLSIDPGIPTSYDPID